MTSSSYKKELDAWWDTPNADHSPIGIWQAARQTAPVVDAGPCAQVVFSGDNIALSALCWKTTPKAYLVGALLYDAEAIAAARQSGINEGRKEEAIASAGLYGKGFDAAMQPLIEALVVRHIYSADHDNDPRKALNDLLSWEVSVNLDPAISSSARKLINEGLRMAARASESLKRGSESMDPAGHQADLNRMCMSCADAIRSLIKE